MCCFSRPVEFVMATRIFARFVDAERQAVVYSMRLGASQELAMILPIPVAQPAREDALKFVDLSGYPHLFRSFEAGFPRPAARASVDSLSGGGAEPLEVVEVGSFVASFVPTVADFGRLDERFRLSPGAWEKLGDYSRHGFAVFQLKPGRVRIHPMAFTFPTSRLGQLFFPTVHVHDEKVHRTAKFDHILYCQLGRGGQRAVASWAESDLPAGRFVEVAKTKGLVAADRHIYRLPMAGRLVNADILLAAA